MNRKVKIRYKGREAEATPISMQQSQENWNQYLLEDGSLVKIKLVATEVVRVTDEYDNEGNPVYLVKSTNVVSVQAPDNLRKGG